MGRRIDLADGTGVIATVPGYGVIQAAGLTVPVDGSVGYATGCLFQHLDGGDGTALYLNEGTNASSDFNAIDPA